MEHVINGLLRDFEAGKLTRRQLIQALALGVAAGPVALAAAQKLAEQSSIPPTAIPGAVEDGVARSHLLRCLRLPAKHRVLSRPDGMGDHSRRWPEAVLNEGRQCGRHHHPKSRRIRGRSGRHGSTGYHWSDRPHLLGCRALGHCQSESRTGKTWPKTTSRHERQVPKLSRPRS